MKNIIQIHSKITSWRWYKESNVKSVFFHLIITACQSRCLQYDIFITRGQVVTSYRKLSKDLGLTVSQVRTSIKKLHNTGEVDIKNMKKFTIITLLNYESYQSKATNISSVSTKENNNQGFLSVAKKDDVWLEQLCMHNKLSKGQALFMLDKFYGHLESKDEKKGTLRDFKSHYYNWLKYQNVKKTEDKEKDIYYFSWSGQAQRKGTKDEYERAKKTYDHEGFDFVLHKIKRQ